MAKTGATSNLKVVIGELEKFVEGSIKRISVNARANLMSEPPLGTPIDSGWASANWIISVGKPDTSPVEAEGNPASALARGNAGVAQVVAQYKLSMGSVFLANNVPYIVKLNDGWSDQSPVGFIQNAILKAAQEERG